MTMPPVTNNGSRNRQAAFRERMVTEGMVQVTGWVHRDQAADATELLKRLRECPGLLPGPLRDPVTGKLVSAH